MPEDFSFTQNANFYIIIPISPSLVAVLFYGRVFGNRSKYLQAVANPFEDDSTDSDDRPDSNDDYEPGEHTESPGTKSSSAQPCK